MQQGLKPLRHQDKLILVFYISIEGLSNYEVRNKLQGAHDTLINPESPYTQYIIPLEHGESRVECLNPQLVGSEEALYKRIKGKLESAETALDEFMNSSQRRTGTPSTDNNLNHRIFFNDPGDVYVIDEGETQEPLANFLTQTYTIPFVASEDRQRIHEGAEVGTNWRGLITSKFTDPVDHSRNWPLACSNRFADEEQPELINNEIYKLPKFNIKTWIKQKLSSKN